MSQELPSFRYHPDPLATEAILPSETRCLCCGQVRGFIYSGPFFSRRDDLEDALCPWCIADGSAARAFDAEFVPVDGEIAALDESIQEELGKRTVSFTGWQEVEWPAHCDDAMAFVSFADATTLREFADAITALRRQFDRWDDSQFDELLGWLSTDGSPTAYLFRCLHCGRRAAYADFD